MESVEREGKLVAVDRETLGLTFLALLVIVLLAAGAWFLYHPPTTAPEPLAQAPTESRDTAKAPVGPTEITYPGRDGATVLELLKEQHTVKLDTELALFGAIVLKIDQVEAGPEEFWIFYRDSQRGDRPPDVCTTFTGESIRWALLKRH